MAATEQAFLTAVASVLEVPSLTLSDDFRAVPDWSSLKAFGLLVLMENDFATPLSLADFAVLHTVGDLYAKMEKGE